MEPQPQIEGVLFFNYDSRRVITVTIKLLISLRKAIRDEIRITERWRFDSFISNDSQEALTSEIDND